MKKVSKPFAFLLASMLSIPAFAASPVVGPENVRNLRLLENSPMLFDLHRVTTGEGRQFFAYPHRDTTFRKNFVANEKNALLYFDSENGAAVSGHGSFENKAPRMAMAMSLVGGMDYRGGEALNDTNWPGIDGGIYLPVFMTRRILQRRERRIIVLGLLMGNSWKTRSRKIIRVWNTRAMPATAPTSP